MNGTATFDTHAFVAQLEGTGVPRQQAEAHAGALKKVQDSQMGNLVTKADFETGVKNLELQSVNLELRLIKWVAGLLVAQAGIIIAAIKLIP